MRVQGVVEVQQENVDDVGSDADDADVTEDDEEDEGQVQRDEDTRH